VVHLHLKVVPGGSRSAVVGAYGDRLRIKVAAPPEAGKANKEVLLLLATRLGIGTRQLDMVRGSSQPLKTVAVVGLLAETVATRLAG
jgi:uncharacterized protein (TIGR00251 family)